MRKIISEHRETFDEDNMRDFIDLYLKGEKSDDQDGALTGRYRLNKYEISVV